MPVPDQPVRPSVEHLEGDHGAVRHEGTAIVETGCLVGQAPHPEAVQPMPHALPVGSDREGRAANQNGAPGRDRGFEHGSPLPGSVGAPEGAGASGVPAPPWMKTRIWRSLVERATSRNEGNRAARYPTPASPARSVRPFP